MRVVVRRKASQHLRLLLGSAIGSPNETAAPSSLTLSRVSRQSSLSGDTSFSKEQHYWEYCISDSHGTTPTTPSTPPTV